LAQIGPRRVCCELWILNSASPTAPRDGHCLLLAAPVEAPGAEILLAKRQQCSPTPRVCISDESSVLGVSRSASWAGGAVGGVAGLPLKRFDDIAAALPRRRAQFVTRGQRRRSTAHGHQVPRHLRGQCCPAHRSLSVLGAAAPAARLHRRGRPARAVITHRELRRLSRRSEISIRSTDAPAYAPRPRIQNSEFRVWAALTPTTQNSEFRIQRLQH